MTTSQQVSPPRCDYEGSNYQQEFWNASRAYEDLAERAALSKLLPPTGRRIMEIGAGAGRLGDLYLRYDHIILVDPAKSQLMQARERWGHDQRFRFVQADIYNLPFPDLFCDTIVTVRVLHHLKDLGLAFDNVYRILTAQGVYITEFANKRNLKAVLRHALGRAKPGENPWSTEPFEFVPLNIDYHPDYVRWQLQRAGLRVTDELAASFFRVGALKAAIPARQLARLDALLQQPLAGLRLTPSIFLRTVPVTSRPAQPEAQAQWRCPACGATTLDETAEALNCTACGRRYSIEDGVVLLRLD
jgi:SAM-dependent methyltransferase